jgi:hypothetical protein
VRCECLFILRQKGRAAGKFTRCLLHEGHPLPHKAVKPGGVVYWRGRKPKT